jgi:hypothetical protein
VNALRGIRFIIFQNSPHKMRSGSSEMAGPWTLISAPQGIRQSVTRPKSRFGV